MKIVVAAILLLQSSVFAQTGWEIFAGGSFSHTQIRPAVEIFNSAGQELLHFNQENLWGGTASVSGYAKPWLGATLEVSDSAGTPTFNLTSLGLGFTSAKQKVHLNELTAFLGPTVHARAGRFVGFGRVMFGTARASESLTANPLPGIDFSNAVFAWSAGGGIDYKLKPFLSIRISQVDFIRTYFEHDAQANWRESAGVVFCFGGNQH